MIKEEFADIRICYSNLEYYKLLKYNCKSGDIIKVPADLIKKNSRVEITAICDICGKEKLVPLRNYHKCYNISDIKIYACMKCSGIKNMDTNQKRYGVEHALQNKEIKNKKKKTCLEKYGVEYPLQNKEIKEKFKKTCLNKFGVEHPFKNDLIKSKIKSTLIKKYGVEYPMQSKEIQNKSIKTCISRYNVTNISKLNFIKDKKIQTTLKKYGVKYPMQSNNVKEIRKKTCLLKYNVPHEMQNTKYYNGWLAKAFKTYQYEKTDLFYQSSFEKHFLDLFFGKTIIENGLKFEYKYNGSKHYYFSDFYMPGYNLIIEIKSSYTFNKNKSINLLKKLSVLNSKYNFVFIVDMNYDEIFKIIQLGEPRIL